MFLADQNVFRRRDTRFREFWFRLDPQPWTRVRIQKGAEPRGNSGNRRALRYDQQVNNALNVLGAVTDVFTWLGALATGFFAMMVLVIVLQQKTWTKVDAMIETEGTARVARWFDDRAGTVGAAILTPAQAAELGSADHAAIWVQPGRSGAVRLEAASPARRPATAALVASATLLVLSLGTSIVLMIIDG